MNIAKEATDKLNQKGTLIEFLVCPTSDPKMFTLAWRIRLNEQVYSFNTTMAKELIESPDFDLFGFASKQALTTIQHAILHPEDFPNT